MLDSIREFLATLDPTKLPPANVAPREWTYEQYCLVDTMRGYHNYLWFETNPNSPKANRLLTKLAPYFNRDGGYIYQG